MLAIDRLGFAQGNETTSTPTTNLNILWGAVATAALGATLADWQRKREEEEARKRAEAPAQEKKGGGGKKTPGQRAYEKKMQHKRIVGESQALLNEKAREKKEQAEKARQNLIAKNEDRAPVDMAKVNQLVEEKKKADVQAGLAAYYEGRKKAEEAATPLKKEEMKSWWEEAWDTAKTFVQEKIVEPVQKIWNQYVYQPIIQPVARWWKEDVPVWAKETGLSLIPIVGDGWGLIRQTIHFFKKEPVDKWDVGLSLVGLVFDIPWPQEGFVGGDVTIAILKGLNAAIPSGPARDVMTQLIKGGLKNPEDLARIIKVSEALLKNDSLLKALIDNPQALETVMRYGPDAVEILGKYGDEAVKFTGKYGDEGINFLSKNKLTPNEISKLVDLPSEATELAKDVGSKIDIDYKNNPLRIEYENKVTNLNEQLQETLQRNNGVITEADAKALSDARRNLGIEYKDATPGPLRDYIYELNTARYGDPLGPNWDFLMDRYNGDYRKIAEAATRPNKDINALLSSFDEWLNQKEVEYLLDAELKILRGE